jgi:RNA polymerase primary sigma factor
MEPTVYKVKNHEPATRGRRPRSSREPLDLYFDQARRYPRLNASQERTALIHLVELRRERWAALTSLPSLRAAVLEAVASIAEQPLGELPDDSEATFVAALETLDVDGTIAERVVDAADAVTRGMAQTVLPPAAFAGLSAEELGLYHARVRSAAHRYLRARNRFVCSNLRLVAMVADRYSGRSMALADRVQEGNLGLIKAVERFDPGHGTRFSTYAVWWIRHAITRALVDRGRTVRIPAHLHAIFTKVRAVRTELEGRLGRPARLTELAQAVELPVGKVRVAIEAMSLRAVALDASEGDDEQPSWSDRLGTPAPQGEIDARLDACRNEALACQALSNLGVMERHILERRFELHGVQRMTLEALGQHYHLSRERIRQIQNRALAAIRQEVETSPVNGLAFA